MRIPQKTVLLAACTMLAGLLCASGLSTDLIEAVANRAAESLARTQEAKVFKVDTQGRLVATDPQGREPTDVLATPTNTGDTLTPLHLDKQADRVYYKVSWNGGERVESRGLYGEDLKTLVSLANQSLYSAAHNKLYWTRDQAHPAAAAAARAARRTPLTPLPASRCTS